MIRHLKRWNYWRKHSKDSVWEKICVLFGVITTPTWDAVKRWF